MIELLSPAGDFEKLKIAYLYGADACYIGGKEYSLRANASNFTRDDIKRACLYAHSLGKKLYVTVNIVFHDKEIEGLLDYLYFLEEVGCDAVIISDPLVFDYIRENGIGLAVHISTQGSTSNMESVRFWHSLGASRVVLAREVSGSDISDIVKNVDIDIEVFLHGAMCSCFSGRCVLSNYFTNRDSNRGGCAQVCRFVFDFEDRDDFSIASKDLNLGTCIPSFIEMGVCSLKIEGRMRSTYYVATVISCYRKLIDAYYNNTFTSSLVSDVNRVLARVSNRESSTQFFKGDCGFDDQYYLGRKEESNQDFLGIVLSYDKENKEIVLEQRNYFSVSDRVVIFTPGGKEYCFLLDRIYDSSHKEISVVRHPREVVRIPFDEEIEINSIMRVCF